MEPPSRQLVDLLTRYKLATSRDLRRCRPLVRRLARDLPTFDSVWIDALTQNRAITPFQAKLIESDDPTRLEVGPCVLVDEWQRDGHGTLCLAKHKSTGKKCLLTYVSVAVEHLPKAISGVRQLINDLRSVSHPSIITPQGCDEMNGRLVVVSPYTTGATLQQLLVRRGRFPISAVTEITRQLLDALAALETKSLTHGDLRLTSVRLTTRGQIVLLNSGVLPAVGSRVSFHDPLKADAYDGTAPELISTGRTATGQSDLYALGCLLWQLLAGRPPFPTGDPLSKLAAHQSRPIDDVRRWRPDTPETLANVITKLTQKDPDLRPASAGDIRVSTKFGSRGSRSALAQFHASFGTVAPRHGDSHRSASKFPWSVAATLLFVLSGLSLTMLDAGARNELLRLASRVTGNDSVIAATRNGQPITTAATNTIRKGELLPLPTDPVDGVIELISNGPYTVADITTQRALTIRAAAGVKPVVIIADRPLRITAPNVQLRGLQFETTLSERRNTNTIVSPVLLAVRSQQLSVDSCLFRSRDSTLDKASTDKVSTKDTAMVGTAIAWQVADEADPTGGRFVARRTTFRGDARAVDMYSMPRIVGFDNCLKRGDGSLVRLSGRNRSIPLRVHLRQTTLRDSDSIISWTVAAAEGSVQPTLIVAENSVFALRDDAGLLRFLGEAPVGWERLLRLTGEGSLLRPNTAIAVSQSNPLDSSQLRVEGLLIDEFEFAANDDAVTASVVTMTQAPRSTPTPPGIDVTHFTTVRPTPVVRQASHEYNAK